MAHGAPKCFNPRPPLLAGDAVGFELGLGVVIVSIRARHYWRAMQVAFQAVTQRGEVSIRARHYWRAMHRQLMLRNVLVVSIRARHYWRAMLHTAALQQRPPEFQSAPAITGGRCR